MPVPAATLTRSTGWIALLVSVLLGSPAAQSQTLLDAAGATAVQGSLNGIGVPGSGSIVRARQNAAAAQASLNGNTSGLPAPTGGGGPGGAGSPAAPAPVGDNGPGSAAARVNGQGIPICSHGSLCHGALLRAMGNR